MGDTKKEAPKEEKPINMKLTYDQKIIDEVNKEDAVGVSLNTDKYYSSGQGAIQYGGIDKSGAKVDFGESQYDTPDISIDALKQGQLNEYRAQRQSGWDKAGNAVPRFAGRVATSAAELVGDVYGLAKYNMDLMLEPGQQQKYIQDHGTLAGYKPPTWTTIFDNSVTRGLGEIDKGIKEVNPQYESKDYKDAKWYEKLKYANFYASDLVDGAAFAVGSAVAGGLASKFVAPMFKLASAGDMAKVTRVMQEVTDGTKTLEIALKEISKEAGRIKRLSYAEKFVDATIAGTSESGQEARGVGETVFQAEVDKRTKDPITGEKIRELTQGDIDEISAMRDEAEGTAWVMNMLVTGPTNLAIQSAFYKKLKGLKGDKGIIDDAKRVSDELNGVKPNLKYKDGVYTPEVKSKLGSFAKGTGKAFVKNSQEMVQEMYQTGVSAGVADYYNAKFDGKEGLDQMLKSTMEGFNVAFSDEGLYSGLLGFLTPGVSNTLLTKGSNIKEALGKYGEQTKADVHYSAMLNKLSSNKVFKTAYEASTRHQVFQNQLDGAIENSDDFEAKNQMHNIMTNLVLSRVEAGRTEDLKADLESFRSMSKEEFKDAFGVDLLEENRDTVTSFIEGKLKSIGEVVQTREDVKAVFTTLSSANQTRLIHATLAAKDSKGRADKLSKEATAIVANDYATSNQTYQGAVFGLLHQDYNRLSNEEKAAYRELVPNSGINPLDQAKLVEKLNDIDKLKGRGDNYVKLYNELVNPKEQAKKDVEDNLSELKSDNPLKDSDVGNEEDAQEEAQEQEEYNNENDQSGTEEVEDFDDSDYDAQVAAFEAQNQNPVQHTNIATPEVAPVITPEAPIDNRPAKVVLTEGKKITPTRTQKILKKIKQFMGINENINNHITLKAVQEGDYLNVWVLLNGEHVANLSGNVIEESNNELSNTIKTIVQNSDKEFTPKELGIYFGLTDGSLDLIGREEGELTPLSKLDIDYSLTGGQTLVYDFNTREDGKYTSGSWIGTVDNSLFKPGVVIDRGAIPSNLGRYILVIPMPNGSIKYVRVRPSKLDSLSENNTNQLFGVLSEKAKAIKASLTNIDKTALDEFNADFNSKFYIAVDGKLVYNKINYDGYQINIDVEPKYGKIRVTLTGRIGEDYTTLEKVYIAADSKVGSLDAFLGVLNKEFKGQLNITRNDFKASITEENYISDMVASVRPSIVKGQSLVFRKGVQEDVDAKVNLVDEEENTSKQQVEETPIDQGKKEDKQGDLQSQIAVLEGKVKVGTPKARRSAQKELSELLKQLPKGDEAYKIDDLGGKPLQQSEIDEVISMLPKFISIQDISKILDNLRTNGIPLGLFKDKVIYLNSVSATRGVAYHEAFHAVFRTVLSDIEITRYLSEAKKEYSSRNNSAKLRADIDRLRNYSPEYARLSIKELEELVYEEYLADKFSDFKKDNTSKSPFRRLFTVIKDLLKLFKYNSEELSALFDKISNKAFSNSELKDNRFTKLKVGLPVYTLIPAGDVSRENEETGKFQTFPVNHTQQKSEKMIATFAAKINKAKKGDYGKELVGMTDEEAFNHFVEERLHELTDEFEIYFNEINETDPNKANTIADIAVKEVATYDDLDSLKVLQDAVQKRLDIFKYEPLDEENDASDENNEGNTTEVAEKFGSQDSWLTGGHESLPKLIKQYISFSTYMEFDPVLGREVEVAVDAVTAYNGLTRILADTPRSQMIDKLFSVSKYNPNMKAVIDRLIADTGMVLNEDGTLSQPSKNFNDYQIFLNTFDNSLTKQIFTLIKTDGSYQVQNANKNDAKSLTPSSWANNIAYIFKYKNLTPLELSKRYEDIEDIFNSGIKSPITSAKLDAKVKDLEGRFLITGIKLSKGFIEYSILKTMKDGGVKLTKNQSKLVELNEDIIPFDPKLFVGEIGGFKGLGKMIASGEDLFSKEEGKGAYTRLEELAEANGMFDETIGNASFKNAEGKSVFEIIKSSYVLAEAKKLSDPAYIKQLLSGKDKNNDLNDRNYKFISKNFLLNTFPSYVKNLKISIIDGLRKEDDKTSTDGVVFGNYDGRSYLLQGLAYFADTKKGLTNYIFRQNEAANTAYIAALPVQQLSENGKPNRIILDALYDNFKNEAERISRETKLLDKKGNIIYKGYNDKPTGRAFDFTEFQYIKDINPELYAQIVTLAKESKLDELPEQAVRTAISDYLIEGIKRYKNSLQTYGIVKLDDGGNIAFNNFMPKNLSVGDDAKYANYDEAVIEFYLNDYLMSNSLNELFDGDYSISRKDKVDISKRNKGAMGSGNNYGSGSHRVSYIKDIVKYLVKEPENGNLIRIKEIVEGQYIGENGKSYTKDQVSEVNTADAQSEQSLVHKIYSLYALGKLDNRVWSIYKKILKGESISNKEQGYLELTKSSLNPDKTVTFGMGIYHKTSEHTLVRGMISYVPTINKDKFDGLTSQLIDLLEARDFDKGKLTAITKQLAKIYKPVPGFEYHHNLANQMDIHGIDQVIAESASKGATLIPTDSQAQDMDLSKSMTDVLNEYKRLQTETPTGKDTITDGSQLIQLIDSEQVDESEFTFPDGTKKSLGAIRAEYRSLMSSSRSNAFIAAKTYIKDIGEGKIDKTKLDKKLLRSLEASGSDDVILELFGKPYNFNMSNMVDKAEQIVLAHFSKGVLNQKVNGGKVSLVSDAGMELPMSDNGEIIPYQEVIKNPDKYKNYRRRSLGHNLKDSKGNVFSECLLSERILTKHGLVVGDKIPDDLLKALGYRIPTQDKHSMMAFKIVGLLPNYMEGVGIFPHEIVHLSGADFDIDSEFMHIHDYWMKDGVPVKYGTEKTIDDKWDAFIYYKTNVDKEFKYSLKANKGDLKLTLVEFKLPVSKEEFSVLKQPELLNNGVVNNRILDARIAMLTNAEMLKKIAYTPSSTKSLATIADDIDELKESNKEYKVANKNVSASDLNGKFESNTKNSAGSKGIGVVANKLQVFAFLAKVNTKLSEGAFKFQIGGQIAEGYKFLSDAGHRIADTLSTILSVMTDNAKDPIAGRLNLSLDLLPGFSELISQGLPEYEAALVINQPIIQLYSKLKQARGFAVKNKIEEGFTKEKTISAAIAAYKLRDTGGVDSPEFSTLYKSILRVGLKVYETSMLSTEDMKGVLNGTISDKESLETIQINALIQFTQIEAQSDVLANINTLLKLNQGLNTSFSDLGVNLLKSLEELGVAHRFGVREQLLDEDVKIVDIYPALKEDPLTVGNVKKALEVLEIGKKLFISQTDTFTKSLSQLKDILNISYRNKKDTTRDVSRVLLGYISTKGYLNLLQKTIDSPDVTERVKALYTKRLTNINGTLIYKDLGGETLAQQLTKLKGSTDKSISDNSIIKHLQVEVNDADSLELVTTKSFAKESKETISILLDSFKDLYNRPETKDFAVNMFNYLIVKDNLEFRNNTFIKYVAPFMFDKLSNSLDITLSELSKKDGNIENVLGDTMDNVSYNFRKLYATYIGNKFGKLKYKKLEGTAGFTIEDDQITFDVFGNLNPELVEAKKEYIKEQKEALIEKNQGIIKKNDKIDYSFEQFPTLKEGTKANRDYIDSVFENEIINGNKLFIFPQFSIFNGDVYELTEYTTYDKNKQHPKNESVHKGNSAIYTKLETIGNKKISPFSNDTYEDALQTANELSNTTFVKADEAVSEEDQSTNDEVDSFDDMDAMEAALNASVTGQGSIDFDGPSPAFKKSEVIENKEQEKEVKSCNIGPF